MNIPFTTTFVSIAALALCPPLPGAAAAPSCEQAEFGRLADGTPVQVYTLRNAHGMTVKLLDYGAIITELWVPDRTGALADVVLGYPTLAAYLRATPYFGAVVGRYANRIAAGRFSLDGETFVLARNDGANHLHGGIRGFDKVLWQARPFSTADHAGVELNYLSADGEEGYPGNLRVRVVYLLNHANELIVQYQAMTDRPTVVNLSQHSYFNLRGHGRGSILDHELTINADRYTPVDAGLIPTGELAPVAGSPFDFTRPQPIGARIHAADEQLRRGGGYDHNWVLNRAGAGAGDLAFAARLYEPASGRELQVWTTEPGLQFYSGNFLDGSLTGKGGAIYHYRYGLCLETQHFPDSPNQAGFPSTRLDPGQTYSSRTVFRFSVQ
jgi:aldose 1-epimerase